MAHIELDASEAKYLESLLILVLAGHRCSLRVDGWTEPWRLSVSNDNQLMATCPTSETVVVRVGRPIPQCWKCGHKATSHAVDDEERRECMEPCCGCQQFEVVDG